MQMLYELEFSLKPAALNHLNIPSMLKSYRVR